MDWKYVDKFGCNLFFTSFQPIVKFGKKRPNKIWLHLVPAIEERFEYLIAECEKKIDEETLNSILEIPVRSGCNCFRDATKFSEKITNLLLKRGLSINSITLYNEVASFKLPQHAAEMIARGVNPKIIRYDGKNCLEGFKDTFSDTKLMDAVNHYFPDPIAIHFTTQDIDCGESCPRKSGRNCPSRFKKFYYKEGPFVEMRADNKLGSGGFGMVYEGMFHGKAKAMKITPTEIKYNLIIRDAVSELEKNIAEYDIETQLSAAGSGVIIPEAFIRQQNQERDVDGKWIAKNYNIYVYPVYHCDLYKLHEDYFHQFTEAIVADIIHQCFIRIGSYKKIASMLIL